MKTFLAGLVVGLAVLPAGLYLYFSRGYAPVAAKAPEMPFEKRMARMALHARISKEMPAESPVAVTEPNLVAGAKIYREHCSYCHGLAGEPETASAKGMFPHPPQLLHGKGVTDDPAGETYWKAANGIRLTGMPGYRGTLTEEQLWQVSLLLANADKAPAGARQILGPAKSGN